MMADWSLISGMVDYVERMTVVSGCVSSNLLMQYLDFTFLLKWQMH